MRDECEEKKKRLYLLQTVWIDMRCLCNCAEAERRKAERRKGGKIMLHF